MKKFILVCIGAVLFCAMIIGTIRFWGLGQTYKAFENDFFKGTTPYKIIPWEQSLFLEKDPNLILWVDVYRAEDETLIARPWADREVNTKNLERKTSPTRPAVIELLKQHPDSRFVFNIIDNVEKIHLQVVKIVEEAKSEKRILIQSDFPAVITSIREEKPMMVYGSSARDLVKLKMMEALWVVTAAPFRGDALVLPLTAKTHATISAELAQEMRRRNKVVILGPLSNPLEVESAKSLGAQGLFVSDPLLLL